MICLVIIEYNKIEPIEKSVGYNFNGGELKWQKKNLQKN